jgi:hypothetical protein
MSNLDAEKDPAATAGPPVPNTVPNGADGENKPTPKPMQAKSFLKQVEDLKAKAEPAGDILGGGEKQPDIFDNLSKLVIPQNYLGAGAVKKQLTTVPVGRPNRQTFFRIHPGQEYAVVCGLYEARNEQKIDKRCYLVMPEMCGVLENEIYYAQLFLGMTRQGNPFIWPVRLPRPGRDESAWSVSAREAIVRAFGNWIRIGANMDLGAYDIYEAEIPIDEPVWPDIPYGDILRVAFKREGVIDRIDHPIIQKLRGA